MTKDVKKRIATQRGRAAYIGVLRGVIPMGASYSFPHQFSILSLREPGSPTSSYPQPYTRHPCNAPRKWGSNEEETDVPSGDDQHCGDHRQVIGQEGDQGSDLASQTATDTATSKDPR